MEPLSRRERDVVNLLLEGKSNKLIASALHISERTVEFHLNNIYQKFQVGSRVELILKLGQSTVEGQGQTAENRDSPNERHWAASLRSTVSTIGEEFMMSISNASAINGGNPMTFFESLRVCLAKYADFNGRASRSEFWWFALFVILVGSAMALLSETARDIFLIAILLPLLAVGARRLVDIGISRWWLLYLLVPVGGIILLGFYWAKPATGALPDDNPD